MAEEGREDHRDASEWDLTRDCWLCGWRKGPHAPDCRQPLKAGEEKEEETFLEPPKRNTDLLTPSF